MPLILAKLLKLRVCFKKDFEKFVSLPRHGASSMASSTVVLCRQDELSNGQVKECDVDGSKLLLVKDNDRFYALGAKCTHYGAPLSKGAYCQGIIRCPWHGACFNVESGDIEDYPGFDRLPTFDVKVENGDVAVTFDPSRLNVKISGDSLFPCQFKPDPNIDPVVVIGGGGAAASCIESLRQNGFKGPITMVSAESVLPYDRPKLSKALGIDPDSIALKKSDYYEKLAVHTILNSKAISIDANQKVVHLEDGKQLTYGKLVVATGSEPRRLDVPCVNKSISSKEVANIFYLRNPADGKRMADKVQGKHVVVVGSSFIGMEIACVVVGKQPQSITVVSPTKTPFEAVFGSEIGLAVQNLFESKNVHFKLTSSAEQIQCNDQNEITGLLIKNVGSNQSETVPCDVCIVGIGVTPCTDILKGTSANFDEREFVEVDQNMQMIGLEDVYACGDIVKFPLATFQNQVANIQHWQMALKHGKIAGQHITGKCPTVNNTVPFFWTVLFGKSIRYTGYSRGFDELCLHGSAQDLKFVAYFLKQGVLVAVATCQRDPVAAQLAEYFRTGRPVTKDQILKNTDDLWNLAG